MLPSSNKLVDQASSFYVSETSRFFFIRVTRKSQRDNHIAHPDLLCVCLYLRCLVVFVASFQLYWFFHENLHKRRHKSTLYLSHRPASPLLNLTAASTAVPFIMIVICVGPYNGWLFESVPDPNVTATRLVRVVAFRCSPHHRQIL